MDISIRYHLPKKISKIKEYEKSIIPQYDKNLNATWSKIKKIDSNLQFDTIDFEAVERWEKILNISTHGNLSERRAQITALVNDAIPYTELAFRQKLDNICGASRWETTITPTSVEVEILDGAHDRFDLVMREANDMVPANMALRGIVQANISIGIKTDKHSYKNPYILCGTRPEVNTPGGISRVKLAHELGTQGTGFKYNQTNTSKTGEMPGTAMPGGVAKRGLQMRAETKSAAVHYPLCGEEV